jgi:hypothetical protein
MQNHPSKLGTHWWKSITLIHQFVKFKSNKTCTTCKKTNWTSMINLWRWKPCRCFASIETLEDDDDDDDDDDDLVVVTYNGFGKYYNQFWTSH